MQITPAGGSWLHLVEVLFVSGAQCSPDNLALAHAT